MKQIIMEAINDDEVFQTKSKLIKIRFDEIYKRQKNQQKKTGLINSNFRLERVERN